ncbi:MAG: hypothetical protein SynsKO_06510 [Synoicihabitans sp.]
MKLSIARKRFHFLTLVLMAWSVGIVSAASDSLIHSGDRIAIVGNTFADQLRMHGYLETVLKQRADVSVRNLGWGGDTLTVRDRPTNFPTEETFLTAHQTDVIVACFGMGESFAGQAGLGEFKRNLRAFVASHSGKKYNGESEVRLVLVSPIAYENRGETTPAWPERNHDLESYTRAMQDVATEAKVGFVNLFDPSRALMSQSGEVKLTTNGIHLNALGYWAINHEFANQLLAGASVRSRLTIDARSAPGVASRAEFSGERDDPQEFVFTVVEQEFSSLPPPVKGDLPEVMEEQRDALAVINLPPGRYTLMVEDTPVATATADAWANGVAIDASPAHQNAEKYRTAVIEKNQQFTYGWKALNQVHIVGERRHSPSGRALPAEQVEFIKLAREREEELRGQTMGKTRQWRLVPTE